MTYIKHLKINIAISSVILVLVLTIGSMSASSVFAHPPKDIEEVKTILETKVDNGDLTQEEADEKLFTLEEKMAERHAKMEAKIQQMNLKIQTAVQNGDLTQEEADEKIAHFQENMEKGPKHAKGRHHKKTKMIMDHLRAKISAAVESGDITQEEADAKLADIDAKRNARTDKMLAKLESIKAEIATAVQNGDLTQEEADEKIAHFQQKMEAGPKHGKHGKRINSQTQSAIDNVSERLQKVISY
ncbi:MAG: hypothetical protein CL750_01050 [Chloroflexi bacterium]|nr:hypothetical protein [Chloroflexota bacterium]